MIKGITQEETVLIFSQDAARLAEFYKNQIGLKPSFSGVIGKNNEEIFIFESEKNGVLYIVDSARHLKRPVNVIFTIDVENVKYETRKLEAQMVKKIQDIVRVENGGSVSLFKDVDGNYFQLVEYQKAVKELPVGFVNH